MSYTAGTKGQIETCVMACFREFRQGQSRTILDICSWLTHVSVLDYKFYQVTAAVERLRQKKKLWLVGKEASDDGCGSYPGLYSAQKPRKPFQYRYKARRVKV